MSPVIHRLKESAERATGLHLRRTEAFPWLTGERRFLMVRLDLHNKCNIRCRMCYFALDEIWNQAMVEMSDTVIERLEREVWPRTQELSLSCATEPLISKKLERVLPRAKQAGIPRVSMVTNGLALNEPKARMLIEGGLDRLCLSLDGSTKETYEQIRTGSKFERVVENVRRLQALKKEIGRPNPALVVIGVLMLENMKEWSGIIELAAELGAESVTLIPQLYYTEFGQDNRLSDHREAYNTALDQARETAKRHGLLLDAPPGFRLSSQPSLPLDGAMQRACGHCYFPWMQIVVYPSGEMTPCTQMYNNMQFGNLEKQSFDEIYFGPEFTRLREELRTGNYNAICNDCPAGNLKDVNDEAAFIPKKIFANPVSQ